jgi:DNA-binding GntR family transcriptional regulator
MAKLKITDKNLIVARKDVAEMLQCPSAQEWLHIEGYRSSNTSEEVVGYTQVFINRAFPKIYERVNKNTLIIFKMFQEIYDESIVEVRQEMRAIVIRDKAAKVLKVPEGTIGMRYITRFYSAKGEQLEVTVNIHPLDKLNFAQHIVYPRPINDASGSPDAG